MDTMLIAFALVAVLAIGGFFYDYYFSRKSTVRRQLKKAVGQKIAACQSGEVAKIAGEVQIADEVLQAPLSGRACVYYHVIIEEYVSSGKSGHWRTIIDDERGTNMLIRDSGYAAFVQQHALKTYIVSDRQYSSGFLKNATEPLEKYLQAFGEKSEGFLHMNRSLRYKEGIVEPGEWIAVIGRGEWTSSSTLKLKTPREQIWLISANDTDNIYLTDDPTSVKKA